MSHEGSIHREEKIQYVGIDDFRAYLEGLAASTSVEIADSFGCKEGSTVLGDERYK